jgi:D-alanyl-D-alanine carboxypeptidase
VISQKTLLEQLANGDVLGDDFEVEEELMATQNGGLIEMAGGQQQQVEDSIPEDISADDS